MLQLSQRPLTSSAADRRLLVDRTQEMAKLDKAVKLGLNTLVLGERGSGKTTLLRSLEREQAKLGTRVVFIEASRFDRAEQVLDAVSTAVTAEATSPPREPDRVHGATVGIDASLRRLGAGAPSALVLLDTIASPAWVHLIFGQHRDEVWQLPFTWVVTGNSTQRARYLEPPADSFFDVVLELDELSEDDAADLLTRRVAAAGEDSTARRLKKAIPALVAQVRPRLPRHLLAAARSAVLAADSPTEALRRQATMQQQAAALGRPAATVYLELEALGPVSASDANLLDRLGWTRARTAQVLKQLQDAGLVVATTERNGGGPGRPRTLYGVQPASEVIPGALGRPG